MRNIVHIRRKTRIFTSVLEFLNKDVDDVGFSMATLNYMKLLEIKTIASLRSKMEKNQKTLKKLPENCQQEIIRLLTKNHVKLSKGWQTHSHQNKSKKI